MIFIKMLLMMLKNSLTHRIMMKEEEKEHYLLEKNKKVFGLMQVKKSASKGLTFHDFDKCVHE